MEVENKIMHMFYEWDKEREIYNKIQKCQRNWDYEKWNKLNPLLVDDIVNELLWIATNSPTKQHEGYFDVYYTADRKVIQDISRYTWVIHIDEHHQQTGETHNQMLVSIWYGWQKNLIVN